MAHYRHLPVWKAAMDLAVHLEHAVRRFPLNPYSATIESQP